MRKYYPVTYVNVETGEVYSKDQLKRKLYKKIKTNQYDEYNEYTGHTYVRTINEIENVREAPKQGDLF